MKQKFINAFMDVAQRFAELSSATKLKVGAIVVKDQRIISIGYNGTPAGWDNTCEDLVDGELKTRPEVTHAERGALDKLAKSNGGGEGASIFVTHSPCLECSKSIYGAGITHVYYRNSYRDSSGLEFLAKCQISVTQVKSNKSRTNVECLEEEIGQQNQQEIESRVKSSLTSRIN
jgi:dCMP deaminase